MLSCSRPLPFLRIHYRARYPHPTPGGHWALLEHLYLIYQREAPDMAYNLEEFLRETQEMVIAEAIKRDPEAILKRFAPEQRLKGLDLEERLRGLDPEQRLRGLDPATIEAWLAHQRRNH